MQLHMSGLPSSYCSSWRWASALSFSTLTFAGLDFRTSLQTEIALLACWAWSQQRKNEAWIDPLIEAQRPNTSFCSSKGAYLCQRMADSLLGKKQEMLHIGLGRYHRLVLAHCVFIPKGSGRRLCDAGKTGDCNMDHCTHKHHTIVNFSFKSCKYETLYMSNMM